MLLEQQIRKLARSTYWLNLYRSSKELACIGLFENNTNISGLQTTFLFWVKTYDSIYEDMATKEYDFLDEEYINDDVRVDAFLYWRRKKYEHDARKYQESQKAQKLLKGSKSGKQKFCNVDLRGE